MRVMYKDQTVKGKNTISENKIN